jgi:diguanylate cyclase
MPAPFKKQHFDPRLVASSPQQSGQSGGDAPGLTRSAAARRDLLERVSAFIIKHDLNPTSANLSAVCTALSGANAATAQAFVAREISGEPIDQRWLDTVIRLDPETGGRLNELEKLMDQLEYSLMRFAQTAKTAHVETSEHRGAIDAQIEQMVRDPEPENKGAEVDRVIDLSRVMIERIGLIETAMERSEAESDKLRANLATARMEADVDHLTRLPNRRAFERRLKSAVQEAMATSAPFCVAFCDVDHFKKINDLHGHDAGDRVLCSIAATLSDNASDQCFVARHGGEEFVLLFYGFDREAAWRKLDGIRRAQAAKQMVNRETGKPFGKVTFSGGIAQVSDGEDPRNALARADAALYTAKGNGRNRIVAV